MPGTVLTAVSAEVLLMILSAAGVEAVISKSIAVNNFMLMKKWTKFWKDNTQAQEISKLETLLIDPNK